ncbi:MAG TPA: ABC transporter substrate-binding protein [Rhizomicrobium sp.]|jgi:iron complex transport system substrate-binding protein|nr:ABC transporter substrate-binding protein [Rhizomicrobium sp.]
MIMRAIAAAVLFLLPGAAGAAPQHIMSLKVCTDELLLDLVPPSRIASVTFLSREKAGLKYWPQAAALPVNHGTAEEILTTRPDLILTDPFMAPSLRPLLAKTGARIVEVPPAENFDQIRSVTRLVAKAVGEEARGEALIARMDADLAALQARRPQKPLTVAGWGTGGYVPGTGGLFNAMLTAAGARNVERGAFGYYDVESLIAANPDVLVYGDTYSGTTSLRADQDSHPALLKRYAGRRVTYDALYGCGVPESTRIARELQDGLSKVRP